MNTATEIQELLNRYWEGETTLEEERRLRDYFAIGPVPEQFRREAELFLALRAEQAVRMPDRPGQYMPAPAIRWFRWAAAASVALLLAAGAWWALRHPATPGDPVVQQAPSLPAPDSSKYTLPGAKLRPEQPEIAQAPPKQPTQPKHRKPVKLKKAMPDNTIEDPEQAVAEIKAALDLISSKIGKGKKELGKGWHEVETLDKIIKKKSDG